MASFHMQIKSGPKGKAKEHARYITREGKYEERDDIVDAGFGNMPDWAANNPKHFWDMADKHERSNGAAYREYVIAVPNEFNREQQKAFISRLVQGLVGDKPYEYAVHTPIASLGATENTHAHVMFSDRVPDRILRLPDQWFSRHNPQHPERGGNRKESGGMTRLQLRDAVIAKRKFVADVENEMLAVIGSDARVDHRSHKARGITRAPETHLGPARIQKMQKSERLAFAASRRGESLSPAQIHM